MRGLVEHRAQQGVATFGHPAIIVDLAGLVALRRQADMRADRPGMVLHRMWVDGSEFRWKKDSAAAPAVG